MDAMARPLSDFEVLTFDCYGTLIDWETGIWDALQPLLAANRADVDRATALAAFGRHEPAQEALTPGLRYPAVLARVHRALAEELGLESSPELDRQFGASVRDWPAFPDSPGALQYLATRYRLVILSNVDRTSFAASNRKLGVEFDAVYTAEDVGSYKPDPATFGYLIEHLERDFGIGLQHVLHAAQSLYHDHAPAIAAGLATAWIDRQRLSEGGTWGATAVVAEPPATDYRFFTLEEMAAAVRKG
jgi:2-haloalkanoic acid dehalogenase type II